MSQHAQWTTVTQHYCNQLPNIKTLQDAKSTEQKYEEKQGISFQSIFPKINVNYKRKRIVILQCRKLADTTFTK